MRFPLTDAVHLWFMNTVHFVFIFPLLRVDAPGSFKKNGSEFNQFEDFKRGKFIVDTWKYGYAVMIPVGLIT
jgi:hypothetical protein